MRPSSAAPRSERQSRSNAARIASDRSCSCSSNNMPMRAPRASLGIVVTWSHATTDRLSNPFAGPTDTSVDSPRIVLVIGAIVTVFICGRTISRVSTSTGRALSSAATWIGRIKGRGPGRARVRRGLRALDPVRPSRGSRRRVLRSPACAPAQGPCSRRPPGCARVRCQRRRRRTRPVHPTSGPRSADSYQHGTRLGSPTNPPPSRATFNEPHPHREIVEVRAVVAPAASERDAVLRLIDSHAAPRPPGPDDVVGLRLVAVQSLVGVEPDVPDRHLRALAGFDVAQECAVLLVEPQTDRAGLELVLVPRERRALRDDDLDSLWRVGTPAEKSTSMTVPGSTLPR